MQLIAHLDDLCIYHWLFVLIISLSIIPTERRVQQCTSQIPPLNQADLDYFDGDEGDVDIVLMCWITQKRVIIKSWLIC